MAQHRQGFALRRITQIDKVRAQSERRQRAVPCLQGAPSTTPKAQPNTVAVLLRLAADSPNGTSWRPLARRAHVAVKRRQAGCPLQHLRHA